MPLLSIGSRGPEVATLQAALNFYLPNPPLLKVDGLFGPKTQERVVTFQRRQKLAADGIVGPKTEAVLYACGAVRVYALAVPASGPTYSQRFQQTAGRPFNLANLLGQNFTLPPPMLFQQLAAPFQLPPLTPPVLTPPVSRQLGQGQQVTWLVPPLSWEFLDIELTVLSRPLKITAGIEAEQAKGSTSKFDLNVVGTAGWTLLPARLRTPSVFLEASAKTNAESVSGGGGLGLEFSDNKLKILFEHNPAFDADPMGRASSDIKVPESNIKLTFGGSF